MRRLLALSVVFALIAVAAWAVDYPTVRNDAWQRGERLTFAVKYGPVRAGTATLAVEDEIRWSGRSAYRIRSTARSVDWFFYPVRDTIITYLDSDGLFCWRYEKHQREGDYRNDEVTTFNHETGRGERIDDGESHEPFETPRFVKDVLGSLYYLRTLEFDVGDIVRIPVSDGRRNYDLEVNILRREHVRVPAGEFDCLVVEPKLRSEGIFISRGRLFVWVTDDERHIPVRIRTEIPVGAVIANLERMDGTL